MESRDFVYLQEAYQQMYQLDEEVEIATEYFYEMGLNEYGVTALIEELGVEEFVEWVYDIAESYTLTEARAGGSRIEPITKSGKAIGSLKGGARTAAINRLRKEKQARREAEERESAERPSGMKAALRSQAMKAAAKSQPKAKKEVSSETKKGIGGLLSRAVSSYKAGTERHKEATEKTKETLGKLGRGLSQAWQTAADSKLGQAGRVQVKKGLRRQQKAIEKVAPAIGGAAGRLASRVPAIVSTYKAGERLGRALREDEEFEAWVEGLWEEGYDLSDYTWEGLYEIYEDLYEEYKDLPVKRIMHRVLKHERDAATAEKVASEPYRTPEQKEALKKSAKKSAKRLEKMLSRIGSHSPEKAQSRERLNRSTVNAAPVRTKLSQANEEVEAYNTIADYLLDEGYAHDLESADAIIASMSEDWIVDILEKFVSPYEGSPSYNDKWGYSPAMRAFRKSEELQKTEPGSKRQKMQTRRSQQLNRVFQAARRA